MNSLAIAVYVPLYFVAAGLMSDRNLASAVQYRIPCNIRLKCTAIWSYLGYDLLFAALALPFVWLGTQQLNLYAQLPFGPVSYAVMFFLMGLLWPQACSLQLTTKAGSEVSIEKLRDRFAGVALVDVKDEIESQMNAWVERVVDAATERPEVFRGFVRERLKLAWVDNGAPSEADRSALRAALLTHALSSFRQLFDAVSKLESIPFAERNKPLMKVPGVTFVDEEVFYSAGITSIGKLAAIPDGVVGTIPAERVAKLRRSAREFGLHRRRFAVGCITVFAAAVMGLGAMSVNFKQDVPKAGPESAVKGGR